MQLTPNSLKCIVAAITLNKVEKKNITVKDFLFSYKVVKTPTNPKAPPKQFMTFYLFATKYYVYSGKLAIDKDWESADGLFVISSDWMSPHFDSFAFPLVNKFTHHNFYYCSTLVSYHILLYFLLMNCL